MRYIKGLGIITVGLLLSGCAASSSTYIQDDQDNPPENAVEGHVIPTKDEVQTYEEEVYHPSLSLAQANNEDGSDAYLSPNALLYIKTLRQEAANGDSKAEAELGDIYFAGITLPVNLELAANWYLLAAQHGDPYAAYTLSFLYHNGWGVKQDTALANHWRRQADQAHNKAVAQREIAERYATFDSRWYDVDEAIAWYKLAAEEGDVKSQLALGDIYRDGLQAPPDYFTALKWYGKAADKRSSQAAYNIAQLFLYGHGVEKDQKTALQWMERSARAGYIPAQYALAEMYYLGEGVKKDNTMAYAWWKIATNRQPNGAISEKIAVMAKNFKPAELTHALELADKLDRSY